MFASPVPVRLEQLLGAHICEADRLLVAKEYECDDCIESERQFDPSNRLHEPYAPLTGLFTLPYFASYKD